MKIIILILTLWSFIYSSEINLMYKAQIYNKKKEYKREEAIYKEIIKVSGEQNSTKFYNFYGWNQLLQQKFPDSINLFKKALKLDNNMSNKSKSIMLTNIGLAEYLQNNLKNSENKFYEALEISPNAVAESFLLKINIGKVTKFLVTENNEVLEYFTSPTKSLVYWNKDRPYMNIGITEFIWCSTDDKYPNTFEDYLVDMKIENINTPKFLEEENFSHPWTTQKKFAVDMNTTDGKALLSFINDTKSKQLKYLVDRLERFIKTDLATDSLDSNVTHNLNKLLVTNKVLRPHGVYIALDYIKFKGEGTNPSERCNNEGWGLKQVLEAIDYNSSDIDEAFYISSNKILKRRIKNSQNDKECTDVTIYEDEWKCYTKRYSSQENSSIACNEK